MAVTFENDYIMLFQDNTKHINERHVDLDKEPAAFKFQHSFNLMTTVPFVERKTFRDYEDYKIFEEGYKAGHGYYYMYFFKMKKVIGVCLCVYLTDKFFLLLGDIQQ